MCGNAYTVLQEFSYHRLFEGHIICVVMLILYFKYLVRVLSLSPLTICTQL